MFISNYSLRDSFFSPHLEEQQQQRHQTSYRKKDYNNPMYPIMNGRKSINTKPIVSMAAHKFRITFLYILLSFHFLKTTK